MDYKNLVTYTGGFSDYQPANPNLLPNFSASQHAVAYESVNPGPMIRGNRKDPNNWSYSIRRTRLPIGHTQRTYWETWSEGDPPEPKSGFGTLTQRMSSPLTVSDVENSASELLGYANEEAYQKFVEEARGSIDLSVDLFQAKQTAKMLNATERFNDAFIWNVPAKVSGRGIAKQMGGKWLEWVYGWKPLLGTIHDVVEETLRHHVNTTVKVKGRKSLKQTTTPLVTSATPNGPIDHTIQVQAFAKVQYIAELRVMDNDLSRLTSLNPASIAWELVPYSFVADWFYDIGGYLRGLETAVLYQDRFVRGFKSTLHGSTCSTGAGRFSVIPNSNGESFTDAFSASSYSVDFNRTVLTGFPFPATPKLKLDLSSGRLLNAAALISQFFKR